MATVSYPARYTDEVGPWLLDNEELSKLDPIFDEIDSILAEREQRLVEEEVADTIRSRSQSHQLRDEEIAFIRKTQVARPVVRRVVASLASGNSVISESIADLRTHPEISKQNVIGLKIKSDCRYAHVELGLAAAAHTPIQLAGSPENDGDIQRAFQKALAWVQDHEAPPYVRAWARARSWLWVLTFPLLGWIAVSVLTASDAVQRAARRSLGESARRLVDGGINESNMPAAIDLLVRDQFNIYKSDAGQSLPTPGFWYTLAGIILLIGFLYSVPRTTIGLGRNHKIAKRWKSWSVTGPALLGGSCLIPIALHWVGVT
jgi:hypothetical protein